MMKIPAFSTVRLPRIIFGENSHRQLPSLVAAYGRQVLLVTGATSFRATPYWSPLQDALAAAGVQWSEVIIDGEPTPQQVDRIVAQFYQRRQCTGCGQGHSRSLAARPFGDGLSGRCRPRA